MNKEMLSVKGLSESETWDFSNFWTENIRNEWFIYLKSLLRTFTQ